MASINRRNEGVVSSDFRGTSGGRSSADAEQVIERSTALYVHPHAPAGRIVKMASHTGTARDAADLLAEAGRTLYGDEWVGRLARDIGVPATKLRAWKAGRLHLSLTDDAFKQTLHLLERRRDEA